MLTQKNCSNEWSSRKISMKSRQKWLNVKLGYKNRRRENPAPSHNWKEHSIKTAPGEEEESIWTGLRQTNPHVQEIQTPRLFILEVCCNFHTDWQHMKHEWQTENRMDRSFDSEK